MNSTSPLFYKIQRLLIVPNEGICTIRCIVAELITKTVRGIIRLHYFQDCRFAYRCIHSLNGPNNKITGVFLSLRKQLGVIPIAEFEVSICSEPDECVNGITCDSAK